MTVAVYAPRRDDADERVVNKDYQKLPIGRLVKRWLQALRFDDASENTLVAYEIVGARLALEFPDSDLAELAERGGEGVGRCRFFLEKHWLDSAPATRAARLSALRSFMDWAVDEDVIDWNPADRIKRPRGKSARRQAQPQAIVVQFIYGQDDLRDRVCCSLLARFGLRKEAVRLMQARDVHRDTGTLGYRRKGGGWDELPYSAFESLALDLDFLLQAEEYKPREYILYPRRDRSRPMERSTMHRWFKRRLDAAGLPDFKMHQLRHSAADFTRRATDSYVAKDLLGHVSVGTTETYLHSDMEELRGKLEVVEVAWQEQVALLRSGSGDLG